ncbi:hypothetical protein BV898_04382 [Hypsibius exemplaris]|uniref:Uncharacterized protein n=1 Tax=Hypsibius exemplaris TaxID=2072580 RepID=A0A1W0X2P8_HYPEX|nr:hypothetical protein BV898_04382 [Hypsibius exemplaris]
MDDRLFNGLGFPSSPRFSSPLPPIRRHRPPTPLSGQDPCPLGPIAESSFNQFRNKVDAKLQKKDAKIARLEEQILSLRAAKRVVEKDKAKLVEDNSGLAAVIRDHEATIARLTDRSVELATIGAAHKTEISSLNDFCKELQCLLDESRAEVRKLERIVSGNESRERDLQEKLHDWSDLAVKTQEELVAAREEISLTQPELRRLQEAAAEWEAVRKAQAEESEKELSDVFGNRRTLDDELREALRDDELKDLRERIADLKDVEGKLNISNRTLVERDALISTLRTSEGALQLQIGNLTAGQLTLEKTLQAEIQSRDVAVKRLEEQLSQSVKEYQATIQGLMNRLQVANDSVAVLSKQSVSDLERKNSEIATLTGLLEESVKEKGQIRQCHAKEIISVNQAIAQLRDQLQTSLHSEQNLSERLAATEGQLRDIERDKQAFQREMLHHAPPLTPSIRSIRNSEFGSSSHISRLGGFSTPSSENPGVFTQEQRIRLNNQCEPDQMETKDVPCSGRSTILSKVEKIDFSYGESDDPTVRREVLAERNKQRPVHLRTEHPLEHQCSPRKSRRRSSSVGSDGRQKTPPGSARSSKKRGFLVGMSDIVKNSFRPSGSKHRPSSTARMENLSESVSVSKFPSFPAKPRFFPKSEAFIIPLTPPPAKNLTNKRQKINEQDKPKQV